MKKSELNKIIKELVKEQYDFGPGLEPDLGLGNFGMGSYCSGPSPCDTFNSEQACNNSPGCEWIYGQTGSSFGSSIDVAAYQAWATTFFNSLFNVYMNSGFNTNRACAFLTNRYNVLKSKFDGTWDKPGVGNVQFGPRHRNTLAAKIYHIYYLMIQWGCPLPTNEQRDPLAGMDWREIIENMPGVKSMVETTVMAQLNELKAVAGDEGGDMNQKPPVTGKPNLDVPMSDMPMITPSKPVEPVKPTTKNTIDTDLTLNESNKGCGCNSKKSINEKQQLNEVQTFECNGPCDRCQDNCGPGEISTLDRMSPGSNSVRLCYCASGQTAHTPGRGATRGKTSQTPSIKAKPGLREVKKAITKMLKEKKTKVQADQAFGTNHMSEKIAKVPVDQALDLLDEQTGYGYVSSYECQNPNHNACGFLTDPNYTPQGTGFNAWMNKPPNGMNIKFMMKNMQGRACNFGNNVKNKLTAKLNQGNKGPDWTSMINFKLDYVNNKLAEYNCS